MQTRIYICLILLFISSHNATGQAGARPLVFGVTEIFESKILGENRIINIYLPEEYNVSDTVEYPVIYVPDGGTAEDFFHISGIVRYNTQPWIARFPKTIVVGIENTNRKRDFTFAVPNLDFLKKTGYKKEDIPDYGGSAKYIAFLQNELQPYMREKYKATGNRTIIGESLAGLLLTEILLKHTDLFDTYIIISPSLWWGDEELLKQADGLIAKNFRSRTKVYIAAPDKKEDRQMFVEAETLFQKLQQASQVSIHFDYLPAELHSTVIHQAVYNAFKKLYPKTAYSH